jgi:hypothetical protein
VPFNVMPSTSGFECFPSRWTLKQLKSANACFYPQASEVMMPLEVSPQTLWPSKRVCGDRVVSSMMRLPCMPQPTNSPLASISQGLPVSQTFCISLRAFLTFKKGQQLLSLSSCNTYLAHPNSLNPFHPLQYEVPFLHTQRIASSSEHGKEQACFCGRRLSHLV